VAALIEFLKRYNYWFVFILLEVASFVLLFRFNSYQGSVWFTQTNSAVAKVNSIYTDIEAFIHLDEVNAKLTKQNSVLQMQVSRLREQLKDAKVQPTINDRHILDSLSGRRLYSAKVVSASIVKNENYIVIDKGAADGIKPEMGVVGGGGVVGIVSMVNRHHSMVLPLINRNSRISCRIRRTGYYGSLTWEGGSIYYANLMGVPQYARAKHGDAIETSGYSTVFPPGLFVGKVRDVKPAPDGLSMQLVVNLGTNFGNLRDVTVFENLHKQDILELMEHSDSTISKPAN